MGKEEEKSSNYKETILEGEKEITVWVRWANERNLAASPPPSKQTGEIWIVAEGCGLKSMVFCNQRAWRIMVVTAQLTWSRETETQDSWAELWEGRLLWETRWVCLPGVLSSILASGWKEGQVGGSHSHAFLYFITCPSSVLPPHTTSVCFSCPYPLFISIHYSYPILPCPPNPGPHRRPPPAAASTRLLCHLLVPAWLQCQHGSLEAWVGCLEFREWWVGNPQQSHPPDPLCCLGV